MTEQEFMTQDARLKGWQRHRFLLMVGMTIFTALFLVSVAMALYVRSGAAQLDLSRPGYMSVRAEASRSDEFTGFSSTGVINTASLDQFRGLYDVQAERATNVDSFGGDVISDQALSIDNSSE